MAKCNVCGWHAVAADADLLREMAHQHIDAVGHSIKLYYPEGWFKWHTFDIHPAPKLDARGLAMERMAQSWNPPGRYQGD